MTPTPSVPVEPKPNPKWDSYIEKACTPKETSLSPVSVGTQGNPYCFWQPHNYRLYIDFDKSSLKLPQTEGPSAVYRLVNSKEICFDNYHGCRIVIKKTQVEITNLINPRWYRVELGDQASIEAQFRVIIRQKDKECLDILKAFIGIYGGSTKFHILNARSEDKIMGEDVIAKLPDKMVFHGELVKKVYNEKNVEFTSPAAACTYIQNRAIETISPEILRELKHLSRMVGEPEGGYFYTSDNAEVNERYK